jgi:hypothetical protein
MDKNIYSLVTEFRRAIECAKNEGEFKESQILNRFPNGCCGIVSSLLAKYLFENGIYSSEISGTYRSMNSEEIQSHMWLILEDNTIIDITGDQFKNNPTFLCYSKKVYVGLMDQFHELFEDTRVYPYDDFTEGADKINIQNMKFYKIILGYIQN